MGVLDKIGMFENKANEQLDGIRRINQGRAKTLASRSRLDLDPLHRASCHTSNNPRVRGLFDTVKEYNETWRHPSTLSKAERAHAIGALDAIYGICTIYMTNRVYKTQNSVGGEAKRKMRYEAFETLIKSVIAELELYGGRSLVGPADFRSTARNYWLERMDPHNRAGYLISGKYKQWLQSGKDGTSFWEWLRANGGGDLQLATHVHGYNNPGRAQWEHHKHFDQVTGELRNDDDSPFCTRLLRTEFSKDGWAVWVCSMMMLDEFANDFGNFIFSNTHRAGWDHHSSFLGGNAVMAAGEWVVTDTGRIKVITAKSGHYMPKWENLQRFVTVMSKIPGNAIIRPNMLDHNNGADTIKYYRVSDFRQRGLLATPLRRNVVLDTINPANTDIIEHWRGGQGRLRDMLPP